LFLSKVDNLFFINLIAHWPTNWQTTLTAII